MPTAIVGWFKKSGGVSATPGYSLFLLPWAGTKGATGITTRTQSSATLGGGIMDSVGAQNDEIDSDYWLDTGTYKWALIYGSFTDRGKCHLLLGASDKGNIDCYDAVGALNVYAEVTGIAVTAGNVNVQLKMSDKNASSSNYKARLQSLALIRTGA